MRIRSLVFTSGILLVFSVNECAAKNLWQSFAEFLLRGEVTASAAVREGVELDGTAGLCLGCHNGARATEIVVSAAADGMRFWGSRSAGHPIGMPYAEYAAKNPEAYRARSSLRFAIPLVDGKVTCISCHKLRREAAAMFVTASAAGGRWVPCMVSGELTMGSKASDLCLACHRK